MFHQAKTVAIGDNIKREEEYLKKLLKKKGYPGHIIQAAATWNGRREEQEEEPKYMYTIRLPYVAGLSEDLRGICRKYSIW